MSVADIREIAYMALGFERRVRRRHGQLRERSLAVEPRIWVLLGDRPGDNLQCLRLAELVGLPFVRKHLVWATTPKSATAGNQRDRSLSDLVDMAASGLGEPWPDLVISAGRACGRVARTLRLRTGGRTRALHIGNPRRHRTEYDLVVAAPQYGVPPRPNVFNLDIPLIASPSWDRDELDHWRAQFSDLPRPWIVVMIGGPSRRYQLTSAVIRQFCDELDRVAAAVGGSVLATTSRRTPAEFVNALNNLAAPHFVHVWERDSGDRPNPYWSLIALADTLIVTGDSASMLVEGTLSGAPLYIFNPPRARKPEFLLRAGADRLARWIASAAPAAGPVAGLQDALNRWRIVRYDRDMRHLHEALYDRGLAAPFRMLGTTPMTLKRTEPSSTAPRPGNLDALVARVRGLVGAPPADMHEKLSILQEPAT